MATHTDHSKNYGIYFITFTCCKWRPLFEEVNLYSYFNKWFEYLKKMQADLVGYIIMPNHFHALKTQNNSNSLDCLCSKYANISNIAYSKGLFKCRESKHNGFLCYVMGGLMPKISVQIVFCLDSFSSKFLP